MRKSKIITIEGRGEVTVKELTVAQVDELFNEKDPVIGTTVELLLGDGIVPVKAVTLSTGLSYADMVEMPPSDLKDIWNAVEGMNDFLCLLLRKLAQNITTAAVTAQELQ